MKRFRLFTSLLVSLGLGVSVSAQASQWVGTVVALSARSDGVQYVLITGSRSTKPSCATYEYMMISDEHSDTGKAQFAMLLSAYMSGKVVYVTGTGTCVRWGDGEDILVVTLSP